jgi:hypothetical protein
MMEFLVRWLPLVLALGLLVYGFLSLNKSTVNSRQTITVLVLGGLVVCLLAAWRDGFGLRADAVLAFDGLVALGFSIVGIALLGLAVSAMVNTKPGYRYQVLKLMLGLIIVKLIAMEMIVWVGGR